MFSLDGELWWVPAVGAVFETANAPDVAARLDDAKDAIWLTIPSVAAKTKSS